MKRRIFILPVLLLLFVLVGYAAVSLREVRHENNYTHYTLEGLNILVYKQESRKTGFKLIEVTREPVELAGLFKSKNGEYTAIRSGNRIHLYNSIGILEAYYQPQGEAQRIISFCIDDLDRDGYDEIYAVEGETANFYGERLVQLVFDKSLTVTYSRCFKELNPWKVQTADVDGDGIRELSLGVYKTSNFDPVMAKRPFIYSWSMGDIAPKWRGSRLSRPFEDYVFSDVDNDAMDELIAIERLPDGKELLDIYKWKGFGFEQMTESEEFSDILALKKYRGHPEHVYASIKEGQRIQWRELVYQDQSIKLLRD